MLKNIPSKIPKIILVEPEINKSIIIQEFFKNRNIAEIIEISRDGFEIIDFLKNIKINSKNICAILINSDTPYIYEAFQVINNDYDLKNIPIIIFSKENINNILSKYGITENVFVINPMDLLSCSNVIDYLHWYEISKCG